MWLKYHHKFSAYISKEVHYYDLRGNFKEDDIKDALAEITDRHESEHYRGVDYELVKAPTVEALDNMIGEDEAWIANVQERVDYLKRLRKQEACEVVHA